MLGEELMSTPILNRS